MIDFGQTAAALISDQVVVVVEVDVILQRKFALLFVLEETEEERIRSPVEKSS